MSQSVQGAAPVIYSFNTHAVRVVIRNGDPWFVANDVCAALGYVNTSKAVADHLDDDERSTITNSESRNGGGKLVIINESGLYALVLRSRKPEARKFAKWVTSEVLPAIRKTGRYEVQPTAPASGDADRVKLAMEGAAAIAAKVQSEAFAQLINTGRFSMDRWMLFFNFTNEGAQPMVKRIESNACIMSPEDVLKNAYKGMHIDPDVIHDFVIESIGRMRQRTEFYKARSAQGQLSL